MKRPSHAPIRLHAAFAVLGVAFLAIFSWAFSQEYFAEWRTAQARFREIQANVKDAHQLSLAPPVNGIRQIWLRDIDRVDRCPTCHLGADDPAFAKAPQPFTSHAGTWLSTHPPDRFGCTTCHGGQGEATTYADAAHKPIPFWGEPMRPGDVMESNCGICHRERAPRDAPELTSGRATIAEAGCAACHDIPGFTGEEAFSPRLENVGYKLQSTWLRSWLTDPASVQPGAKMPKFRLGPADIGNLEAFLLSKRTMSPPDASTVDWSRASVERGRALFERSQCLTCHKVEGKGGSFGPELSAIGTKVRRDWLFGFIKDPMKEQPETKMLRYQLADDEVRDLAEYLMSGFGKSVQSAAPPEARTFVSKQVEAGREAFVRHGCYGCHRFEGMGTLGKIGPSLANIGARQVEAAEFARRPLEPTLANWLQLKVRDPQALGEASRMPTYAFTSEQNKAVAVALMSLRKADLPASRVVADVKPARFEPQGQFGALVSRYRCLSCHSVGGFGGNLVDVPLDRVGSQYQRDYLASYLEQPYPVRLSIEERMPHFGMTREAAVTLAEYFARVLVDDQMEQSLPADAGAARRGEQLIARLECRGCHRVAGTGEAVGPDLANAGRRLKPGWIIAWVMNPQKWRPGTLQPELDLKLEEAQAIAAYLMTQTGVPVGARPVPAATR